MVFDLRNIPVFITGATGFIGSHLCRRLVSLGATVHILVRKPERLFRIKDIQDSLQIWHGDLGNFNFVKKIISGIKPVKIYHLAAYVNPARSTNLLESVIEDNVKGTVNLLRALENIDFDCFVNTGTCEEYGDNPAPFTEEQRENPVSPYSASKVATTYFCQMLYKVQGLPIVTLRPFLTYGPYQESGLLIPSLIKCCLEKRDFKMSKGEQTREFNYVDDIVEGFYKASITEKAIGEIINLGNGKEYRILELVEIIIGLMGNPICVEVGALPYRKGETTHFFCSNKKARSLLNWNPKTDLIDGLKKTIDWYKGYYHAHR